MSLPRLLQAEETTCSKQRRAEHAHLNHTLMEMYKYSAVTEAMGALHAGSGPVIRHTETVLPRRRSDKALSLSPVAQLCCWQCRPDIWSPF